MAFVSPSLISESIRRTSGMVLMLPLMGSAVVRGSDAGAPSSGLAILLEPGALVAGWGPSSILSLRIAGLFLVCVRAGLAMKEPASRLRTLIVPIGALGLAIAVSMLAKPMLKVPVFAANLLPFLALGAGVGEIGRASCRERVL